MKQLTMTKVLTPLAALAFAFGAQAAAVSTETFDTYTAGTTVISNQTGWSFTYGTDGADDASAVTAYDNNTPSVLPYGVSTAGANYLKLSTEDGTLFRSMDGDNGAAILLNTGVFVDTDVQFTVTDASDSPTNTVSQDDKLVIWLEANGNATNLCVLGHSFGASTSDRTDKVYTLVPAAGGTLSITPGDWYRLTVKAVSSFSLAGESVSYPAFQVYLNGAALKASEYIGTASTLGINQIEDYKPYIPARTATMTSLTKVGFSGEGALDSVVVTREVPVGNPAVLTFNWDSPAIASVSLTAIDATITPSGSSFSVEASNTPLALALNAASGYNLANYNITVGGVAVESLASITVVPDTTKTINIVATPKDTVKVTFSLDPTTWADYADYITSVMIGDSDVTTQAKEGIPFEVDLKVGTNVTVAVNLSEAVAVATLAGTGATELTINGLNITVNEFGDGAAEITIGADTPGATMGDVAYATFADALNAAKTAHSGSIKLGADPAAGTFAIGASDDITVDLAGHDINGVDGSAVFTVAAGGTLTITNSAVGVGAVIADTDDPCISNAGTLNLQAGKFSGAITGGTINVTGGAYTAIPADATVNYPTGQELVEDTEEVSAYVYKLGNATYTVTYYDINDDEITESGTTYTYGTGLGPLASAPVVTGKTFGGWYATSARTGDAVTSIGAAETGAKAFYAKYTDNTYTIKFVYGLNGETTNTQSLAYNTVPTAPDASYVNVAGYTWDWDVAPVAVVADATYTAVYTPIEYTVLFISGEGTTTTQTIVKTYGQTILAEEVSAAASVSGKNFTAWDPVPSFPITVTADATYTAQYEAAGGSDWSDTPAEIPAETSAATQYPALKDSALATADAKELTVWAKAKGVAFSDIAADATGTYVDAFLLNCTTEQVAAEKAAFKLNITVGAGGAITVTLPDGKIYNGDLQMKGSNDLSTWTDVNAASSSYKFYKYSLGL